MKEKVESFCANFKVPWEWILCISTLYPQHSQHSHSPKVRCDIPSGHLCGDYRKLNKQRIVGME